MDKGSYTFKWFEGEEVPEAVGDILNSEEIEGKVLAFKLLLLNVNFSVFFDTECVK